MTDQKVEVNWSIDGKVLREKLQKVWDKTKKNLLQADEEYGFLEWTLPTTFSDLKIDSEIGSPPSKHSFMTMDDIVGYFDELVEDHRIHYINGKSLDPETTYVCDYCNVTHMKHGDVYWYCNECNMDMCTLCKDEDSADKADENKAKRWHERKHALEACRKHGLTERKVPEQDPLAECTCNICGEHVLDTVVQNGEWFENREQDFDVCLKCSETDQGKTELVERKMTKHVLPESHLKPAGDAMFGSLMDWIPLIQSNQDGHLVLQNLNPDSPWHLKFALMAVDNHGRCGYFTLWQPITFQEICDEIETISKNKKRKLKPEHAASKGEECDDGDSEFEGGDDDAISKMMDKRHMKTYYG